MKEKNTSKNTGILIGILAAVVIVPIVLINVLSARPGKLDGFAQCISDSGAKFYGAYWCPHCLAQKKMFGKSAKLLPYVECSNPDKNGQTQICKDAGITGYPTWVFPDNTRLSGEIAMTTLAEKTSCNQFLVN